MAIPFSDLILSALLASAALVWTRRALWMRRFSSLHPPIDPVQSRADSPKISVVIPARNEEKNIGRCLARLFYQRYPDYEIIVVDDRSEDRTPEILAALQKLSPVPMKIVRIDKKPEGWTGKNYAVHAGSRAAQGEWILFTDADTAHEAYSLPTALETSRYRGLDCLTLAPKTECRGFWEKTVQPIAVGAIAVWFDPVKINDPKQNVTLANGQFILVRRDVYEKIGGNEAVKTEVVEDVAFAKNVRKAGHRIEFLDGTKLYATRMYSSLTEIRNGWTRILTYLLDRSPMKILHKIFLFVAFSLFPFAVLAAEKMLFLMGSPHFSTPVFFLSLLTCVWIVFVRAMGNKRLGTPPGYALLHPLGSLVMVWILTICLGRVLFNRPSAWKGELHK